MKKQIRRWANYYKNQKKKRQLRKIPSLNLESLIESCEELLLNKIKEDVHTKFRDLGGVNNHGMLLHYSNITDELVAISKIERKPLAEREYRFLLWQETYRGNTLASTPMGILLSAGSEYACLISSVLEHPKCFSYLKAESLFNRLGEEPDLLPLLSLDGCKEHLAYEITASTKIKSILTNVVSKFKEIETKEYINRYLSERANIFSSDEKLFLHLKDLMDSVYAYLNTRNLNLHYGLVHGDFKAQNILEDKSGYKVIDCQYYTYGIRLWDLAFLYSKEAEGFDKIKDRIDALPMHEEQLLVIFLYILASLINVKKKRAKRILECQISPAVNHLNSLSAMSDAYE